MSDILRARPGLDDHDFHTLRDLYAQAQNWARHYETLVVSTNVLLISASSVFVGLALKDSVSLRRALAFLAVPMILALVGLALTRTLFSLYAACIERLIRYENLLNCYDDTKLTTVDGVGSFLEPSLHRLPVRQPASVRFFIYLHLVLLAIYAGFIALAVYVA